MKACIPLQQSSILIVWACGISLKSICLTLLQRLMPIQYLAEVKPNFNCWWGIASTDPLQRIFGTHWLSPSAWGKRVSAHSGRCKKVRKNKGCVLYKLVLLSWTPAPSGGIEVSREWAVDCLFFSCNAIHHAISNADNRFQAKCYGMRRRGKTGMPLHIQLWETWDKPNHFFIPCFISRFVSFFCFMILILNRPTMSISFYYYCYYTLF